MPDVVSYVGSGTYNNGTLVTGANMLGLYESISPRFDIDCVAQQSGILDNRFDDKSYYTS